MRRILALLLAAAMSLSLFVVAGAEGDTTEVPNEVRLVIEATSQQMNTERMVNFKISLNPQGTKTIGAFQFTVEGVNCTLVKTVEKNNSLLYDEENKTGIFTRFGGDISDGKYSFVAAGTVPPNDQGKDERMWKPSETTHIVTLQAKLNDGENSCRLKVITDGDNRLSVGNWDPESKTVHGVYTAKSFCEWFGTPPTTGVTVSGTALSWDDTDNAVYLLYPATVEDATIKAQWKDGSYNGTPCTSKGASAASGSKQYAQTFTFTGVASGDYKLVIFKPGKYVPKIVPITVSTTAYDCGQLKLWLYGDVNYDGKIRTNDATMIYQHIAKMLTLSNEQFAAADVTQDTRLRTNDATEIYKKIAKKTSVFDSMK